MAYNDVTADTLTQLALDEQNERERLEKRALRNRYAQLFRNAPTPNVQPVEPDSPMTIAELEALAKSDPKEFYRDNWAMYSGYCGKVAQRIGGGSI